MISLDRPQETFRSLLRPVANHLAGRGATANRVLLTALSASVVFALLLCLNVHFFWFLLPVFLAARFALTTIGFLLARERDMSSDLNIALDELCGIAADTALLVPFMIYAPTASVTIGMYIFLAVMTEMCGLIAYMIGHSRRRDGPLRKDVRTFIAGLLGFLIGIGVHLDRPLFWIFLLLAGLAAWTCVNRLRAALGSVPAQ